MKCRIYMGEEDIKRQELNVFRMKMLGAEVVAVTKGQKRSATPLTPLWKISSKIIKILFIWSVPPSDRTRIR